MTMPRDVLRYTRDRAAEPGHFELDGVACVSNEFGLNYDIATLPITTPRERRTRMCELARRETTLDADREACMSRSGS
jgi:hypothetical protein